MYILSKLVSRWLSDLSHSNHVARCINRRVRLAKRLDDSLTTTIGGTEVDKQYLVKIVMNDLGQFGSALNQLALAELAFKHAVLQMIAPVAHRLINFAKPLGITNVVGNDIRVSHDVRLADKCAKAVRGN